MKTNADTLSLQLKILGSICRRDHVTLDGTYTSVWSHDGRLVTTNGHMTVFVKSPVTLKKPVNCAQFHEAVRRAKGAELVLRQDGAHLSIAGKAGESKIDFATPPDPVFPKPYARKTGVSIPEGVFGYAARAMSREAVRYALNGICLDGERKNVVASDGKRLHRLAMTSSRKFEPVIIPSEAVAVLRMIEDAGGKIHAVALSGDPKATPDRVQIEAGDYMVDTNVIIGTFPDYTAVFPSRYHWMLQLETDGLRRALKDACSFLRKSDEKSFAVQFDRKDDLLQLVVRSLSDKKPAVTTYPLTVFKATKELDGVQWLTFNPSYLLEALWTARVTTLQGSTTDTPILIDGAGLVCPIKPQTGPEKAYLEKVAKQYAAILGTELPVEPAAARTPDGEPVKISCPTFDRCVSCGVNMKASGKDLCDACARNAKVETPQDLQLPPFERVPRMVYTLRKKKLRDAQYDIHEVWKAK